MRRAFEHLVGRATVIQGQNRPNVGHQFGVVAQFREFVQSQGLRRSKLRARRTIARRSRQPATPPKPKFHPVSEPAATVAVCPPACIENNIRSPHRLLEEVSFDNRELSLRLKFARKPNPRLPRLRLREGQRLGQLDCLRADVSSGPEDEHGLPPVTAA